jgi:NAD(P)-dependent dehydrogenase (short-subunit alcohol dehydrogenase family)
VPLRESVATLVSNAVLEAGDSVVATARRPEQLTPLVEQYGEGVLPVALDVTNGASAQAGVEAAISRFGRIDVLVNNAGYANIAPVETAPEEDFRRQFETNFWGVYNVSKAALSVLKRQGSGTIVQFSSIGGRVGGTAGLGSYQAAKFAVDGFTRVLATETAPFGIRYLTVEPSGFATDWAGASMEIQGIPAEYDGTVGAIARLMDMWSRPAIPSAPAKFSCALSKANTYPRTSPWCRRNSPCPGLFPPPDRRGRGVAGGQHLADFGQPYPVDLPDDGPDR